MTSWWLFLTTHEYVDTHASAASAAPAAGEMKRRMISDNRSSITRVVSLFKPGRLFFSCLFIDERPQSTRPIPLWIMTTKPDSFFFRFSTSANNVSLTSNPVRRLDIRKPINWKERQDSRVSSSSRRRFYWIPPHFFSNLENVGKRKPNKTAKETGASLKRNGICLVRMFKEIIGEALNKTRTGWQRPKRKRKKMCRPV